jgi:hypothetical protein
LIPRRLRVELAPSVPLATAVIGLHLAAALCVLLVMPALAGAALAAALAALGAIAAWSRALLRSPSSVRALVLEGPKLELELANGEHIAAELAGRRYVGRFMVSLPIRRPVRRTILVTADMAQADSFRRLRIWALWGKLPAVAATQLPA